MAYIALVCLLIIGLDAWRSMSIKSEELGELAVSSSNLAKAAQQQADAAFKETDTFLNGVIERVKYGEMNGGADAGRLHAFLASNLQGMPQLDRVSLFDAQDNLLLSSRGDLDTLVDIAPIAAYFRTHADVGVAVIESPVHDPAVGKWFMPMARRLSAADGSYAGVALAMLNLGFFEKFYETLDVGSAGAIAMMLNNGTWLMRFPYREDLVGAKLNQAAFHQLNPSGRTGSLRYVSSLDGVERYSSYRRLDRYPIIVFAGLSVDEAMANWRRGILWHAGGVLLLVLMISLMGMRLLRQSNELERLNLSLLQQAMQDGLTGLANRRRLDQALTGAIKQAGEEGRPLSLAILDVDHFKLYNDSYGHTGGDACLKTLGHTLRDFGQAHEGCLVARYGGEEFALLLPGVAPDAALALVESVRQSVQALAIEHHCAERGVVTISAGVHTWMPGDAPLDSRTLISLADRALYTAKRDGRNCVRACTAAAMAA